MPVRTPLPTSRNRWAPPQPAVVEPIDESASTQQLRATSPGTIRMIDAQVGIIQRSRKPRDANEPPTETPTVALQTDVWTMPITAPMIMKTPIAMAETPTAPIQKGDDHRPTALLAPRLKSLVSRTAPRNREWR